MSLQEKLKKADEIINEVRGLRSHQRNLISAIIAGENTTEFKTRVRIQEQKIDLLLEDYR